MQLFKIILLFILLYVALINTNPASPVLLSLLLELPHLRAVLNKSACQSFQRSCECSLACFVSYLKYTVRMGGQR